MTPIITEPYALKWRDVELPPNRQHKLNQLNNFLGKLTKEEDGEVVIEHKPSPMLDPLTIGSHECIQHNARCMENQTCRMIMTETDNKPLSKELCFEDFRSRLHQSLEDTVLITNHPSFPLIGIKLNDDLSIRSFGAVHLKGVPDMVTLDEICKRNGSPGLENFTWRRAGNGKCNIPLTYSLEDSVLAEQLPTDPELEEKILHINCKRQKVLKATAPWTNWSNWTKCKQNVASIRWRSCLGGPEEFCSKRAIKNQIQAAECTKTKIRKICGLGKSAIQPKPIRSYPLDIDTLRIRKEFRAAKQNNDTIWNDTILHQKDNTLIETTTSKQITIVSTSSDNTTHVNTQHVVTKSFLNTSTKAMYNDNTNQTVKTVHVIPAATTYVNTNVSTTIIPRTIMNSSNDRIIESTHTTTTPHANKPVSMLHETKNFTTIENEETYLFKAETPLNFVETAHICARWKSRFLDKKEVDMLRNTKLFKNKWFYVNARKVDNKWIWKGAKEEVNIPWRRNQQLKGTFKDNPKNCLMTNAQKIVEVPCNIKIEPLCIQDKTNRNITNPQDLYYNQISGTEEPNCTYKYRRQSFQCKDWNATNIKQDLRRARILERRKIRLKDYEIPLHKDIKEVKDSIFQSVETEILATLLHIPCINKRYLAFEKTGKTETAALIAISNIKIRCNFPLTIRRKFFVLEIVKRIGNTCKTQVCFDFVTQELANISNNIVLPERDEKLALQKIIPILMKKSWRKSNLQDTLLLTMMNDSILEVKHIDKETAEAIRRSMKRYRSDSLAIVAMNVLSDIIQKI